MWRITAPFKAIVFIPKLDRGLSSDCGMDGHNLSSIFFEENFPEKNLIIQLLRYPHDYGTPHQNPTLTLTPPLGRSPHGSSRPYERKAPCGDWPRAQPLHSWRPWRRNKPHVLRSAVVLLAIAMNGLEHRLETMVYTVNFLGGSCKSSNKFKEG